IDAILLADVVQRADMRMAQRRNRAGLALEALAHLGPSRRVLGQHLDGDDAVEPRIARLIDLAHAARAQRTQNLVRAKAHIRGERHSPLSYTPAPRQQERGLLTFAHPTHGPGERS